MTTPTTTTPLPISETDVLIIGAGPSGLMAAQALARMGVKTRIVDRRKKGTLYGNADGLQARSMEIFESYGLMEDVFKSHMRLNALVTYKSIPIPITIPSTHGDINLNININTDQPQPRPQTPTHTQSNHLTRQTQSPNVPVPTRFPYELTTAIERIEGVLATEALRWGVGVEYECLPLGVEVIGEGEGEGEGGVEIILGSVHAEGLIGTGTDTSTSTPREIVRAKYLLGADGANSWVRRYFQIPMEGEKTEYIWGVMEGTLNTDFPDYRFKCVIQSPFGTVAFIPREDNITRIYVQLSSTEDISRTPDGRIDMSPRMKDVNAAKVLARIQRSMAQYRLEFENVRWSTVFAVSQMVASKFSIHNRIFILGDAVHTHSPSHGQGANASMGDAHNLAWKIAHVLRGWASPALLATYEEERRVFAQGLIEFDKQITKMLNQGDATSYAEHTKQQVMNSSGVGLHYKSTLSPTPTSNLTTGLIPGMRIPPFTLTRLSDWRSTDLQHLVPFDGMWKLLIFAGKDTSSDLEAVAHVVRDEPVFGRIETRVVLDVRVDEQDEEGEGEDEGYYSNSTSSSNSNSSSNCMRQWVDVPEPFRHWERVFAGSPPPQPLASCCHGPNCPSTPSVFSQYGISNTPGVMVLVRPDGYISLVEELGVKGVNHVVDFVKGL